MTNEYSNMTFPEMPLIGRDTSAVEKKLEKIFGENKRLNDRWTGLNKEKYFNITELLNERTIDLDTSIPVGHLNNTNGTTRPSGRLRGNQVIWKGQVQNGTIHGYGRLESGWGYYEGQYIDDAVQVYGLLTFFGGKTYYIGDFVDFAFDGQGKYVVTLPESGATKVYEGKWEKNVLIESENE